MIIRKKLGYIANRISTETKKNGREIGIFSKPFSFNELYMPLSDSENLEIYGDNVNRTLRMFVSKSLWYGKIRVGDRAYLIDEATSKEDIIKMVKNSNNYCSNANYKVTVVAVQNFKLKIEFRKIEGD